MTHEEFQRAIKEVEQERRASLKDAEQFLETMKLHGYTCETYYEGMGFAVELWDHKDYVGHVLFQRDQVVVFPVGKEEVVMANPPPSHYFALTIAGLFPKFD